ncbi:MAG TPA: hypothetical protein PK402_03840, partial [Tepidisphaeraceae bacterium]|nr:hypothetical protein [Tepidisphaeraceae bacterium]
MNRSLFDSLEMRRLLASITLNDGHVKIDGTTGDDEIVIRQTQDGRISFNLNDEEKKIGISNLKSITVESWSGDDSINVHYNLLKKYIDGISLKRKLSSIPFSLDTGKGKDSVEIYALKPSKVFLGDGNDLLKSYVASTVHGGSGDDVIEVIEPVGVYAQYVPPGTERTLRTFNPLVYGNDGNDTIRLSTGRAYGGNGNDVISGAGTLHGEGGNDQLRLEYGEAFGGDGNDTLQTTTDDLFFDGGY